jgi:hypothetical protein
VNDQEFDIYRRVVRVAMRGETISYGDLAEQAGLRARGRRLGQVLSPLLEAASLFEWRHNRPLISAVVVLGDTGIPSEGFFRLARRLGAQPEGAEEREFWNSHIAEVRQCWAD